MFYKNGKREISEDRKTSKQLPLFCVFMAGVCLLYNCLCKLLEASADLVVYFGLR